MNASAALAPALEELQAALPGQPVVNINETGHPEHGRRLWIWGFHVPGGERLTLFHIDPSRSSDVLKEFLGETSRGVVGCDYLSAYRKALHDVGASMQFCWAHLIRHFLYDSIALQFGKCEVSRGRQTEASQVVWASRGRHT